MEKFRGVYLKNFWRGILAG